MGQKFRRSLSLLSRITGMCFLEKLNHECQKTTTNSQNPKNQHPGPDPTSRTPKKCPNTSSIHQAYSKLPENAQTNPICFPLYPITSMPEGAGYGICLGGALKDFFQDGGGKKLHKTDNIWTRRGIETRNREIRSARSSSEKWFGLERL